LTGWFSFCKAPDGSDVEVHLATEDGDDHDHDEGSSSGGKNCHFHAGVEYVPTFPILLKHVLTVPRHCTGEGATGEPVKVCTKVERNYNINLRIGLLFVMLATSSIGEYHHGYFWLEILTRLGVFLPILIASFVSPHHVVFTILRQFGTGIIISTAFIHVRGNPSVM